MREKFNIRTQMTTYVNIDIKGKNNNNSKV